MEFITHKKPECYMLRLRTRPSCPKKGVFSNGEGHVLDRRRACSARKKGMFSNGEGHGLERRRACVALMIGENY